jgi:hypothetical protein
VRRGERDCPHSGGTSSFEPYRGILDDHAIRRRHVEASGSRQVTLGIWFATTEIFRGDQDPWRRQARVPQTQRRNGPNTCSDDCPRHRRKRLEQVSGARHLTDPDGLLSLTLSKGRCFRFGSEVRRDKSYCVNGASPVGDGKDRRGVEPLRPSPSPPCARYALGGVHKHTIEVEKQSATGYARH